MSTPTPALQRPSRLSAWLMAALGVLLCGACLFYLTVRHVLWPRLDDWRPQLVAHLEHALGRRIDVGSITPGWQGLHPTLQVRDLQVGGPDGGMRFSAHSVQARLSWRSLLQGSPRLAELHLEKPWAMFERLPNGRLQFAGMLLPDQGRLNEPLLDWLLSQGEITIRDATLLLHDARAAWPDGEVSRLNIDLRNTGRHHELSVRSDGRLSVGAHASLALMFDRPALSRRADWQRWRGELHLATQALPVEPLVRIVAALAPGLSSHRIAARGEVDELAWLRFEDGKVVDGQLKLAARAPSAQWQGHRVELQSLQGDVRIMNAQEAGWQVSIDQLSLGDGRGVNLTARGQALLMPQEPQRVRKAHLEVGPAEIAPLLVWLKRLPLPAAVQTRLQPIEAGGRLSEISIDWRSAAVAPERAAVSDSAQPQAAGLTLATRFERLWFKTDPSLPAPVQAASGLSGSFRGSVAQGTGTVAGEGVRLSLPRVFADPDLELDRLRAEFSWHRDTRTPAQPLQVLVPSLQLANADASGEFSAQWHAQAAGPGYLELKGRLDRASVSRVARYLPLRIPARVREWAAQALPEGVGEDVEFDVQGDLRDFPFRDPERGRFRIVAKVRDTTLAYSPAWPEIEQIRADLEFSRGGFSVLAHSATIDTLRLSEVKARMLDYRDPMLQVDGRVAGRAQDMLAFVDNSPLSTTAAGATRELRVSGDTRLSLALSLPLRQLSSARVQGSVELAGNEVVADTAIPPVSAVSGQVDFTERGVEWQALQGNFLGGPIRVSGRADEQGSLRVEAVGQIDDDGIRRLVDNPLTRTLSGRTGYTARIETDRRRMALAIESDLVGLASALPAPFDKPAHRAWPLRILAEPGPSATPQEGPHADRIDVRLQDRMALVLERERDPATSRLLVRRGSLAVNDEPVLGEAGLSVLVRAPSLDFDAWRTLLGDGDLERLQRDAADAASPGMELLPNRVSVVATDLRLGGHALHDVVLGATRRDGRWRANVAAREIMGHFDWLDARPGERSGTVVARFDRLQLPRSREAELEAVLARPPQSLPALDITVEDLALGKVRLGRLELQAVNDGSEQQPVWRLSRLKVDNPQASLLASGTWSLQPAGPVRKGLQGAGGLSRSTALDLSLDIQDAGGLLERMGIRDAVKGGQGRLEGAVSWTGSPLAIDMPTLSGDLHLALGQGAFLRADPGAARLIAVLNMQSLQRLLSGDLGRVFEQGFAFDRIDGSVHIDGGIAHADTLSMRGPQAQISLTGQADLKRETQALQVHVTPELDAGLASIAVGAMINPVVGLGSLAAQYVLRKPLQDALGFDIDITGSWTEPTVIERPRRRTVDGDGPPRP